MGQDTTLQRKGTAIGRVRGLGAAHHGTHHWLMQRITAAGNLVMVGFFVISLLLLPDFSHATVFQWLSRPVASIAMAMLVISVFWHARLGLQVMIEDYVDDSGRRFAALLALRLAMFGGAAAGLFFIARIAMVTAGGQAAQAAMQAAMGGAGA